MRAHLKPWALGALGALVALSLIAAVPAGIIRSIPEQYPSATPYVNIQDLAANTAETVTVPAACDLIMFGASPSEFYLRADGSAATIPSGDVTNGTGSMLSPSVLRFVPGATFSVIAPAVTKVTMRCYDLQ